MSEYYERKITMRRYNPPFNGKRYVLNKNTGEIHDLDRETSHCRINDIKAEHIFNCSSYEEAVIFLLCLILEEMVVLTAYQKKQWITIKSCFF